MQYRVGEVLFGQGTTAVGKTIAVTRNRSVPADGTQITVKATGNHSELVFLINFKAT